MLRKCFLNSISLSAFMLGSSAFAQDAPTTQVDDGPVDEIVVTGEKISRSLQDTPASVAVITTLDLRDKNIISLGDVLNRTANLSSSFGGSSFTIRGISSTNVSGAGRGDLATIYIDGSPLPRNVTGLGPVDIWDVEQVEVFRGPQSTLQGRNTLAGAVIINTANPTYEWTGRMRAIASTGDEEKRLGLAIGGPIIEDQVAFRIAGELSDTNGVIENTTLNRNADASDNKFLRAKLLFEPSAIPDLSVLLSYTRDERRNGNNTVRADVEDPFNNREVESNRLSSDKVDLDIGVVTIDYDFSDAFSLTSISAINVADRSRARDSDFLAVDREFNSRTSKATTYTQELRLAVNSGPLSGVIGGYYSKVDVPNEVSSNTLGSSLVNDFGLVNILTGNFGLDAQTANFVAGIYNEPILIQSVARNPSEIETYAAFGDFTYQVSDTFRVFGGFRYDVESQQIETGSEVSIIAGLPDAANFPSALAPIINGVNGFARNLAANATTDPVGLVSPNFKAFLPKLGVSLDVGEERNISLIVQKGYRSGGVGINQARANTFEFDQEFIWNYELSWRSRWLDNALTLNANVFYLDWSDQQVNVQISENVFDFETRNAGSSEVFGFEVESDYSVSEALNIYGSVGYSATEFNEFSVTVGDELRDFSGNEFPSAPKWTIAGGFTWKDQSGFFLNMNANYNSAAFLRADEVQDVRLIEARVLANFKVGWSNDIVGIYFTGNNVFNDTVVQTFFRFDENRQPGFARFGEGRKFGIQLEAKF